MQSSTVTNDEVSKQYTIAIDALCEIARTYFFLGRLAAARHILHTSLSLVETNTSEPQQRLKLLLEYAKILIVDHLLTHKDADLLFSTILQTKHLAEAAHDQLSAAEALGLLGQAHYFTTI